MKIISIAIDGPAGSGKSTVGKMIAQKLNINYCSTGSIFRSYGYKCLKNNIDTSNQEQVVNLISNTSLQIVYKNGVQCMIMDNEDVTNFISTPQMGTMASLVAVYPEGHIEAAKILKQLSQNYSIVVDGREIGSFMLPNADIKFYLDATPEERARRRFLQSGQNFTYEQILKQIIDRDNLDMTREHFPLKKCEDAIVINSSQKSIEEVVNEMLSHIKNKLEI